MFSVMIKAQYVSQCQNSHGKGTVLPRARVFSHTSKKWPSRAYIMELGNLGLTWSCPLASANFLTAVNVVSAPVQWGCRWLPCRIARVLKPSYASSVVLGTRDLSKFGFLFHHQWHFLLRLYPGYFINMYTFYTHKRKPLSIKDALKFWRER